MYCQSSGLAKPFAAIVALEGLLFGVNVSVVSKVVLPAEGLAANITVEGPLISVSPFMDQQVVGFGELSLAELADVALLWLRGRTRRGQAELSGRRTRFLRFPDHFWCLEQTRGRGVEEQRGGRRWFR